MPKIVSPKSTKQEILDAYEELTRELEHRDTASMEKLPKIEIGPKIITTTDDIIQKFSELRIHVNKNLAQLTDTLVAETEKVQQLRNEKETIQKEIQELHQIKAQATTLKNLILLK